MLGLKQCCTFLKNLPCWSGIKSINFAAWRHEAVAWKTTVTDCRNPLEISEGIIESCDLENDMRLICEYKTSNITTVGCFLPAGAMYEEPEERGSALFMEHLIFRRTSCRKQYDLELELEKIGGKLAAVAMRDMFLFYGTAPCYDVDKLVELLADVVFNGIICDEDIITERFAILRELFEMESDGERVVMDYLPTIAYQGTKLAASVYPKTSVVKNMCMDNITSFRDRLFKPCFMTMVCTGGNSFCDMQKIVGKHFVGTEDTNESICGECTIKADVSMPYFRFSGSDLRLRDDDENLGHVAIAIEGPGYAKCDDHCTLTVAKEIVGAWDMTCGGSSHNAPFLAHRAFNTDMCHMYKSFNIGWTNTGIWGCYFVCERMQLEDMMFMVQNEWMRLCMTITEKEVARAVNQCRMRELAKMNDSVARFFDIATSLFKRGYYESLSQRIAKYERVTAKRIREVANTYIYDQCPAVAAIGPTENLTDYNRIRAAMYQLRY